MTVFYNPANLPYTVGLFLINPDLDGNDDCYASKDFSTLHEAEECMKHPEKHFDMQYNCDLPFIMLDGPGIHRVERLRSHKQLTQRNKTATKMWRYEVAPKAGMQSGCLLYVENGWD